MQTGQKRKGMQRARWPAPFLNARLDTRNAGCRRISLHIYPVTHPPVVARRLFSEVNLFASPSRKGELHLFETKCIAEFSVELIKHITKPD
jgi:hypothetical protein